MKAYVFETNCPYTQYWLLELSKPGQYNALVRVFACSEIEWAEKQPRDTEIEFNSSEEEYAPERWKLPGIYAPQYLSVDVWEKYFFPTFQTGPNAYQLSYADDADVFSLLIKECLRLAAEKAGVVLGAR